jgi:PadR family transcriptional regulator, regulatory protein PadR
MEKDAVIDNLIQELRRGVIVLAVLSLLQEELYGYSLLKRLAEQQMEVDQSTLYPLLRRLETQGLLESKWRLEESRPRRYYVISAEGKLALPLLRAEWQKISNMLSGILVG